MNKEQLQEVKDLWKKDIIRTWIAFWVFQLVIGAYHIYKLYPEYPDLGPFSFGAILVLGAAIIGTVLTIIFYLILIVLGMVTFGILLWSDKRHDRRV